MLVAFGLATSLCLICNFVFAPLVVRGGTAREGVFSWLGAAAQPVAR